MLMKVDVKRIREGARLPEYKTSESAGADIYACLDFPVEIKPGETVMIPTGLQTQFTPGYVGLIYPRSGLSIKEGLAPANKVGVIDSDYRGEVMVALHNHSNEIRIVNDGDRIAQFIFQEIERPSFVETERKLDKTERGEGGFGSTGK